MLRKQEDCKVDIDLTLTVDIAASFATLSDKLEALFLTPANSKVLFQ